MEPQKGDLEVTGISRSGRVRKKSSKLMDFQSPDEIEPRGKKIQVKTIGAGGQQLKHSSHVTSTEISSPSYSQSGNQKMGTISSGTHSEDDDISGEEFPGEENEESEESEGDSEESEDDNIEDEELDENQIDPTVRKSIYMSEKTNKRKVMKDGRVIYGKAQRKDKGKSRFTAYMLWAKDVRKQLIGQQSDLASVSRRLGEMWANVPMNEKCIWKRRAKRLGNKSKVIDSKEQSKLATKFLNKGSSSRSKKISESSHSHEVTDSGGNIQMIPTKGIQVVSANPYKVNGIDPLDVAAYLRLLGESLSIIGERLKEHEGQITVSGSLSVLLDSLLCSLGPLMCLTTQIPGLDDNNQHLRDSLQNTLDNIAYVMPGL